MADQISIAIATFNGERYLRQQLDSLYNQTRIPDEIFVSDDGSKDKTHEILEEYRDKYGLKYVINNQSLGVNKNFEQAIRSCNGDYIMICDQDDIWFPDKIEKSFDKIKAIEGNNAAVVSSQCYDIDQNGCIISKRTKIKKDSYTCADTLLQPANCSQGCTLMINKKMIEMLRPFPENRIMMYDAYIGFVAASIGIKYNMAIPLMFYRHHDTNVTARINNDKVPFIKGKLIDFLNRFQILPLSNSRLTSCCYIYDKYNSLLTEEVKDIYKKLFEYSNTSSILKRVICILNMHQLDLYKRIKLIFANIIFFHKERISQHTM